MAARNMRAGKGRRVGQNPLPGTPRSVGRFTPQLPAHAAAAADQTPQIAPGTSPGWQALAHHIHAGLVNGGH